MFYIYDLVDPRDGLTFYVGKGTGDRSREHVRDARKGVAGAKCDRIREILAAGQVVEERIVREVQDEALAYVYEKRRITKLGLKNLTNVSPGGGGVRSLIAKEQPKVSRDEVIGLFTRIASNPEPKRGLWAAALHRAVVRALPRLVENRA